MTTRPVRYWRKTSPTTLEPFATRKNEIYLLMQEQGLEWCSDCYAAVEPDGKLDATGVTNICPFCGTETYAHPTRRKR
jgi:hypothetical protein